MATTNGNGRPADRYSADAIRKQALDLAASLRERAKAGLEEARRMTEAGEQIAGTIVEAVDEYAAQSERLMAYCAETADACRAAGGSVSEMVVAPKKAPPPRSDHRSQRPPGHEHDEIIRKLSEELKP